MEYIHWTTDIELKATCVTLGKFDGIHLGHRVLMEKLNCLKSNGLKSVVFTFDYHPGNLFSDKEIDLIYTEEEKGELLAAYHPDYMISYPFTSETANMDPEVFIRQILIETLDAKAIVVGTDFRFGQKRRGDVAMLDALKHKYGYRLYACEKMRDGEDIISSTRIRNTLWRGEIEKANRMLGTPFHISGKVVRGKGIGSIEVVPTLNLDIPENKLLPPNGVYISRTQIDGAYYHGLTNIGCNPTVNPLKERISSIYVETHLFGYAGESYGKYVKVELHHFLRPEIRFASTELLKKQILQDIFESEEWRNVDTPATGQGRNPVL